MDRQKKTTEALIMIVMDTIGLYRELEEIKGVTIRRTIPQHSEAPNWNAEFETVHYPDGRHPIPRPIVHPLADKIVEKLQSQYDLC